MLSKLFSFLRGEPKTTAATPLPIPQEDVGVTLLHHYESCAKKLPGGFIAPYLDGGGVATIGWGNTYWEDGTKVRMSDPAISQKRADELFAHWHADFTKKVAKLLPAGTPLRDIQVFTCFTYNIGIAGFTTSTALREYKTGNHTDAGRALEMWNKDNGKVVKGLQRRRRAEHLVFDGATPKAAIAQAELDYP
jgi:lysozyme